MVFNRLLSLTRIKFRINNLGLLFSSLFTLIVQRETRFHLMFLPCKQIEMCGEGYGLLKREFSTQITFPVWGDHGACCPILTPGWPGHQPARTRSDPRVGRPSQRASACPASALHTCPACLRCPACPAHLFVTQDGPPEGGSRPPHGRGQ